MPPCLVSRLAASDESPQSWPSQWPSTYSQAPVAPAQAACLYTFLISSFSWEVGACSSTPDDLSFRPNSCSSASFSQVSAISKKLSNALTQRSASPADGTPQHRHQRFRREYDPASNEVGLLHCANLCITARRVSSLPEPTFARLRLFLGSVASNLPPQPLMSESGEPLGRP